MYIFEYVFVLFFLLMIDVNKINKGFNLINESCVVVIIFILNFI